MRAGRERKTATPGAPILSGTPELNPLPYLPGLHLDREDFHVAPRPAAVVPRSSCRALGAGRRSPPFLFLAEARSVYFPSNQKSLSDNAYRDNDVTVPRHLTFQKENRGCLEVLGRPLCFLPPNSSQHAGTHLQQWSMEQAPDTGSRSPDPRLRGVTPRAAPGQSVGRAHSPAQRGSPGAGHSARRGRPAGAQRGLQRSSAAWLPTRRHWEQKRRVRAGSERSAKAQSK